MNIQTKYKIESVGDGMRPQVEVLGVKDDYKKAMKYAKGRGSWGGDAHVSRCSTVNIEGNTYIVGDKVKDLDEKF